VLVSYSFDRKESQAGNLSSGQQTILVKSSNGRSRPILNMTIQPLEAAQMKFLRNLLGITKLDKEKNQCIKGKTGA